MRKLCSEYFYQLEKLRGKRITAKMLERRFTNVDISHPVISSPDLVTRPFKPTEKTGHITNITALLTYSNVTAFKTKYKNGFPCFYCNTRFDNLEILRCHQKNHCKENIMALVKKKYRPGRPDCLVVYVEVTDLKCTLCERSIKNLNALKIHLTSEHKKTMYLQYTDRVIPFKILGAGYMCQICNFYFETFGTIEKHMNTHYRNFVCEQCGAGFIAKNRLKIHVYNIHRGVGVFPCEKCNKTFHTRNKLKVHFDLVHKMVKKIQCPKCPARFAYYFVCQKHLVDVHGMIPVKYKCNVCDKAFTRRFHLSNHIKKDHLDEKNTYCQLCTYNCFSNNELKIHMAKQHGEKLFECSVCEKCYSSQKSLKQHMNIHRDTNKQEFE
ncbi:unnamed protein product [Diatraea saccharalis]|uniref:C2H2-type domain-containing protein n=1 Tax=Diatraea saccharalis TaxID=40085 RepID=A0A9N9R562_9NEOP|nr:unnamed protein product [Diatraea saccharalis]